MNEKWKQIALECRDKCNDAQCVCVCCVPRKVTENCIIAPQRHKRWAGADAQRLLLFWLVFGMDGGGAIQ